MNNRKINKTLVSVLSRVGVYVWDGKLNDDFVDNSSQKML